MQERDQAITSRRPAATGANPGAGLANAQTNASRQAGSSTPAGVRNVAFTRQADFSQALAAARPGSTVRTVAAGDTLTSMVHDHAEAQGVQLSHSQAHRLAQQVASDNKINNVNRIFPGQQIAFASLINGATGQVAANPGLVAAAAAAPVPSTPVAGSAVVSVPVAATALQSRPQAAARHEVLDRTLDRAVAKGFIPPNEKGDVRDKILALASEHRFNPDDFARMTLMESDGMNPRASNQRCHGIIQFCGGPDRGAASAGYAANPQAILGLSVYQQLHLVDRYFDDVGLKNKGPAGLDDLYLSVLMPSARGETRADAPLNVSGPQARYLYEGRDSRAPMTRQSILQGLLQNAAERLGPAPASQPPNPATNPAVRSRLQAIRSAAYEDGLPPERAATQIR